MEKAPSISPEGERNGEDFSEDICKVKSCILRVPSPEGEG